MVRSLCSVEDCTALVAGRGLCSKHYSRLRRTGTIKSIDRRNYCVCGKPVVAYGLCENKYRQRIRDEKRAERLAARADRTCAWCEQPIPVERTANAIFCSPKCKQHAGNFRRQHEGSNTEYARRYRYLRKFGITVGDYERMLSEQGGGCAICESREPGGRGTFHVDHCHESNVVRGLLCTRCNVGLGMFKDDPERLESAMKYLFKYDPSV